LRCSGQRLLVGACRAARVGMLLRDVDPDADHFFEKRAIDELRLDEALFALGEVAQRRRTLKHVREDAEPDGGLVVSRGDEQTLTWVHFETEHGRGVEVGEEDERVVLLLITAQVVDKRGTPGSLLLQPLQFVRAAVRRGVNPFRIEVEGIEVARPCVCEPPDSDAANPIRSFRVFVFPRDVVARARREDIDIVLSGEPLGDETAQMLRTAEHFGAVPLDDERDFHWLLIIVAKPSATRSRLKSATRRRCLSMICCRRSSSKANAPASSAAYSRSFGANWTPAPPRVSGTAAAPYARTGTPAAIASTSGAQNPSCSLSEMYTAACR